MQFTGAEYAPLTNILWGSKKDSGKGGEQQGLGKRGERWQYVLFVGCGVLKKPDGCECGLIKQIPNYPPLSPKTRSDPLLLALFTIHKSDDVEIVTGVPPEQMTFEVEDNGAEYWPDRWNKH